MTSRFTPLDKLPLFASEEALAGALLGAGRTGEWRQIAPLLERRGFPTVDGLMGGRYTPAVRAFFDSEYRIGGGDRPVPLRDGPEDWGEWKKNRRAARQD